MKYRVLLLTAVIAAGMAIISADSFKAEASVAGALRDTSKDIMEERIRTDHPGNDLQTIGPEDSTAGESGSGLSASVKATGMGHIAEKHRAGHSSKDIVYDPPTAEELQKAEEARKAEEAKKAEEARKAEEAKKAESSSKKKSSSSKKKKSSSSKKKKKSGSSSGDYVLH